MGATDFLPLRGAGIVAERGMATREKSARTAKQGVYDPSISLAMPRTRGPVATPRIPRPDITAWIDPMCLRPYSVAKIVKPATWYAPTNRPVMTPKNIPIQRPSIEAARRRVKTDRSGTRATFRAFESVVGDLKRKKCKEFRI